MPAQFKKGDLVQVDYCSPRFIDEWMGGLRKVGPGDVGVVKFASPDSIQGNQLVTIEFPMIGTFGINSMHLRRVEVEP